MALSRIFALCAVFALLPVFTLPVFALPSVSSVDFSADDEKRSEKSVGTVSLGAPHDSRSELAIRRGIDFLVEQQNGIGAFSSSFPVAVTALSGMALLGGGAEYGVGKEGAALERAVDYLVAPVRADERGYLKDRGETRSRMHGHTYAILFLCQVVGQLPTPQREEQLRKVIRSGVDLILSCQTVEGGWGYEPTDPLDEASLTVCCLQSLRAAKDSGFAVPAEPITRAIQYLKKCCTDDGSFRYSLTRSTGRTSFEITAASLSTLNAAGEYALEERRKGMEYLRRSIESAVRGRKGAFQAATNFPFYGNFYVGQVLQQSRGAVWKRWSESVWPRVLQLQKDVGSWESRFGDEYGTAMALLILELPLGYLPLYDR
ncbi:MAG: prenyltransferase/squalene oxidase repeat-containing protein [Planctomycetota bacterium]|nr:prenyltransferase/squalene oxidase repeat-containing protein [Planctomycetota bacterium]